MFKGVVVSFEQCFKLIKNCCRRFLDCTDKLVETTSDEDEKHEIKDFDSSSQLSGSTSIISKKSNLA